MLIVHFNRLVVFDLETASSHSSLDELAASNPRMLDLWQKVHDKKVKAEDERFFGLTAAETYSANAGLFPEFGRITNVSFCVLEQKEDEGNITRTARVFSVGGNDEKGILEHTNSILDRSDWVAGHNVKGFDIPFFGRRCLINGIRPSDTIDTITRKPWEVNVHDTQLLWNFGGSVSMSSSLDLITTSLGLESPKLEHFGAHVNDLFWVDRNYEEIAKYCEGDVVSTLKVLLAMHEPGVDLSSVGILRKDPAMKMLPEVEEFHVLSDSEEESEVDSLDD